MAGAPTLLSRRPHPYNRKVYPVMKAHELAKALLALPNFPVVINGWGSDEGFTFEVTSVSELGTCAFSGANDTKRTPRDEMGYQKPRKCLCLQHGKHTPLSNKQVAEERSQQRRIKRLKKTLPPETFNMMFPAIKPLTPEEITNMCEVESKIASSIGDPRPTSK